ncbi:MAG: NfeD family protein [Dethiobacteria bacterium]
MFKKLCFVVIFSLVLTFVFGIFASSTPGAAPVYVLPVKGEIEPGWLVYFERSLKEAADAGAAAVILELDTPGGYIDTAIKARKLIDESPFPVYGYVQYHALSAGAYLALSTDEFFMAPGATIGAAEPRILGSQEAADEKYLSSWEAEMRVAAEKQGKDPLLAAAMVRKEIAIEGVVTAGELLTLTAQEAEDLGFSDGTAAKLAGLLPVLNLEGSRLVRTAPTQWEIFSGWLIKPVVATLLLSAAFLFLIVEVLTAGFGLAGLLSILSFGLYFGGHFFTGVSGWPAIFLFTFGIILLLIEAFIPGFGVLGAGGLVCVSASIVLTAASTDLGVKMLFISLVVSALAGYLAFKYFQRKGTLRSFVLLEAATREGGFSSTADWYYLTSKTGQSITPLRPAGIAEIEGSRFDVVSEGSYIPAGANIEVIKVEGRRIVVRSCGAGERENSRR